ncbi:MAG: tRNA (N6-isopentenyl adenosine(37)-C2)-methylthiotransferase MiaB [Deferrisomatales bacterium]
MENLRFFIQTFGCQMNDHDSAVLARLLEQEGLRPTGDPAEADVILVNTCAIREKAEQKVYSQLGRYRRLKARRPGTILGVGGCVAQGEGRGIFRRAPYVDLVFGTQTIHEVPEMLREVRERRRRVVDTRMDHDPAAMRTLYAHTAGHGPQAYVTVMQGCDNYCAYCVVPYVRGREVSRPPEEIVEEVERLARAGVVEVTLLGQNVNSYGQKPAFGVDFPELIRRVAGVEGLRRIRFTTSHPKDLSPELIRLFAEEPKLMPHIHLPLQAGSDRVLEAMGRRYTAARYLELMGELRRVCPEIAVTSDMIVGFPGETEEDFARTLAVMEEVVFDGLFSFKFSPRPGTRAADLPDPVPEEVKEARLARLQRLQAQHTLARNRRWEGRVRPVLVEGPSKAGRGQVAGRTPEGKIVNFEGDVAWVGREVPVRIVAAAVNSSVGEAVGGPV